MAKCCKPQKTTPKYLMNGLPKCPKIIQKGILSRDSVFHVSFSILVEGFLRDSKDRLLWIHFDGSLFRVGPDLGMKILDTCSRLHTSLWFFCSFLYILHSSFQSFVVFKSESFSLLFYCVDAL